METVFVEIMGVRLNEPMTIITDIIVAFIGFFAVIKLKSFSCLSKSVLVWFRVYFAAMAVGTFLGGLLGHAFSYYLHPVWKFPGWLFGAVAVSAIEQASLNICSGKFLSQVVTFLKWIVPMKLSILAFLSFLYHDFIFIVIHTAIGFLLMILPFHIVEYKKNKEAVSLNIILAIASALLSAVVFLLKIELSVWFNHNDLGHIVLCFVLYFFYKAARSHCELQIVKNL